MGRYVQVDVPASACPKCGSTSRTKYHRTRELRNVKIGSTFYPKVVFRRTSCVDCGQNRVERVLYAKSNSAGRTPAVDLDSQDGVPSSHEHVHTAGSESKDRSNRRKD